MFPAAASVERDDIGSKRRGGAVRDKLGPSAQSAIDFSIIVRHAPGRKALLETPPHRAPIKSDHLGEIFEAAAAGRPGVERPDRACLPDWNLVAFAELRRRIAVKLQRRRQRGNRM